MCTASSVQQHAAQVQLRGVTKVELAQSHRGAISGACQDCRGRVGSELRGGVAVQHAGERSGRAVLDHGHRFAQVRFEASEGKVEIVG
jgi:hypothetical protein